MTELEIMQHAKDYLDKLAKGIDPLTGREESCSTPRTIWTSWQRASIR